MRSLAVCFIVIGSICFSWVDVLSVTEIFFDGTDEWIEISNIEGESFSGVVYLSGVKDDAVPLKINIEKNKSVVFADKGNMIRDDAKVKRGYGWNIPDTKGVWWELIDDGVIIDEVQISTGDILSANNAKSSLFFSTNGRQISTGDQNMQMGYYGSPGEHIKKDTNESINAGSGQNQGSGFACVTGSRLLITEIFVGGEHMSPFVELQTKDKLVNPVIGLSGTGLGQIDVPLSGHRYPDDYILLSWGSKGIRKDNISYEFPSKKQIESGFWDIVGQSGQVFDRVNISHTTSGSQNFVGRVCGRVFDNISLSTPGHPISILNYIDSAGNDGICTPDTVIKKQTEGLRLDGVLPSPGKNQKEKIALYTHEEIKNSGRYYIKIGKTKRYIDLPQNLLGSIVLSGYFALPNNKEACVDLYNGSDLWLDRLCYGASMDDIWVGSGVAPWKVDNTTKIIPPELVSIEDIIYDPEGSDIGAEEVIITNNSNHLFAGGELRVLIGDAKRKRYIREEVLKGRITIQGSFALPNSKNTCVELRYVGGLLDTYCYEVSKKGSNNDTKRGSADVAIMGLVYDPQGIDRGKESITLISQGDDVVDLSDYVLLLGKTRKKLSGELRSGEPYTITKTRGFSNQKQACVTLFYRDIPIDYWCWMSQKSKITPKRMRGIP